jgi:hypothetical protein
LGSGGQEKDKQRRNAERERGTIGSIKCVEQEEAEGEEQEDVEKEVRISIEGISEWRGSRKRRRRS